MAHSRMMSLRFRRVLLFSVLIALIGMLPVAPASAGVDAIQDIDNQLSEFDDGSQQLTATANYPDTPDPGDAPGAVQLAPIAALRTMTGSTDLPFGRSNAGVVSLGRNIFVVGGTGGADLPGQATSTVFASQVDLATGALGTWQNDPALPAVQHSSAGGFTAPAAPRTRIAIASYATGQDSGYIYVLGGEVRVGSFSISSYSVLRGTVTNGRITSWNETDPMPQIPDIPGVGPDGVKGASAFIATVNGKVYLYLIGGVLAYRPPGFPVEEIGSKYILYAEIDPATGKFVGNAWNTTQFEIPASGIASFQGLWNSTVIGGSFLTADGLASNNVFYMLGGQHNTAPAFNSVVFRADINNDGTLVLSNQSGAGSNNASLGAPRSSHAAVQFDGSVYVTGGLVSNTPVKSVLGSYVQVDKRFPELGGQGSNTYFISTDTLGVAGMPQARSGHGAVAIPFPATNPTAAYVYVIGGSNGTTSQTDVYRSQIGGNATENVTFPNEGWYVSKVAPFALSGAQLKRITWFTDLPAGADIKIQFRVSADSPCDVLGTRTEAEVPWIDTNPGSVDGENNFPLTPIPANCFQYRARLTPGGSGLSNETPYLRKFGIVIEVPGATDLTPKAFEPQLQATTNALTGFRITIRNENVFLPGEPTLPADYGIGGAGSAPGSFFVDLFIYPPGVTPPPTHTIPTAPGDYAKVSIDVLRSELQAGPGGTGFDFVIPSTRALCDYTIRYNEDRCQPVNLAQLFPVVGQYNVVVVVDGDNNVRETPVDEGKAESNNVSAPIPLDITTKPVAFQALLPLIVVP